MLKTFWIALSLIIPLALLSHAEIIIEGQPEYIPMIDGTHLEAYYSSMDANGKIVAFTTSYPLHPEHQKILDANNNHKTHVYVYNRSEKHIELISVTPEGEALKYGTCYNTQCSGDGRFVGFNSISFEFVPFSYEIRYGEQVYLRDRIDKKNYHISKAIDGNPAPKECLLNNINEDGRYVLFSSASTNLTERETNGYNHIFLCDRVDDSIQCVSTTQEGEFANSKCEDASFSSDAMYITFNSYATN